MSQPETVNLPSNFIASCRGEQFAFEEWAKSQGYDMAEHPLHYLFLNTKTDAARMGWKAALEYVRSKATDIVPTKVSDNYQEV